MRNRLVYFISFLFILLVTTSCVGTTEFDVPKKNCNPNLTTNITLDEILELFEDGTFQIQEDWIIEGYVISSDVAGNFFGELYIQDASNQPSYGFQIEIDLRESHLFFEVGSKVFIKLKGLYLNKKEEMLKLGSPFSAFGNISVGRIPALKVPEHIFLSCDGVAEMIPVPAEIKALEDLKVNTLVRFESLEVVEEELDSIFAIAREETTRTLQDCEENNIALINSGFSDFQADTLPQGNGKITGIFLKDGNEFQIVVRDLDDIAFTDERCPEIITEFASTHIFISELADPENNTGARFVELFNSAKEPLDLNKWILRRYTNANTEVSSTIDLSGMIIGAENTLVISPNAEAFGLVYGFSPDLGVSTNSPADSNGDDNLELVDPFGTIIDVFGVVGEDGTGTNHEFEDGRALRNINITQGNPVYTFSEWTIYNDTGDAGTINQPQNAPVDFSPGIRE
ncbi:DUF5689 domain-containing protein [Flagellimonas sp. HMM57]|uniref:DUF5689 domain-containing protein n=1 Tax=unclassified Flagellimonas TaxID=2644544 RepID=UPI0013CFA847|nr:MULTISPECIES: DUF5689 domain-containing protein [unclassified Flagellimonas]UII77925.1 DUF5689 domain-containing protein [Flagellimonas sp. HMM57]